MKDSTKFILVGGLCLLVGAAGGGAGVYFYCKKFFQDKADEEIQNMGEYYISKYGKGDNKDEQQTEEESNEEERTVKEASAQTTYESISEIYRGTESSGNPTSYNNYFDESGSDSRGKGKKKGGRKKKVNIEVVDPEVWDENPANFDTKFLVYYDVDGILIDEESEQIFDGSFDDDKEMRQAIESGEPDDNGILIVQSNFTNTLYHVTVERMAYSEVMVDD